LTIAAPAEESRCRQIPEAKKRRGFIFYKFNLKKIYTPTEDHGQDLGLAIFDIAKLYMSELN